MFYNILLFKNHVYIIVIFAPYKSAQLKRITQGKQTNRESEYPRKQVSVSRGFNPWQVFISLLLIDMMIHRAEG